MTRLTAREQKLIALGLLVVALALAWLVVAAPLLQGFEDRAARRQALTDTLRQDARLLRLFPAYRRAADAQAREAGDYAFPTSDPAAARSAAEARVAAMIASAGGVLHAVRDQPAGPGQVRLRAEAALTLPALVDLLHQLQDSRPYALVDGLNVSAADPATQPHSTLEARVDVAYAYADRPR